MPPTPQPFPDPFGVFATNPPLKGALNNDAHITDGGVTGIGGFNPGVVGIRIGADAGGSKGFLAGVDPVFRQHAGVYGESDRSGVFGNSDAADGTGVMGRSGGAQGFGVRGETIAGIAMQGQRFSGGLAGRFVGDVEVTGVARFGGDVQVAGNLHMTSPTSDIILGDVAEGFGQQDGGVIEPGTVVVLNQHGLVRPGDEPYDKKVAGVVSGAGDYRPAIVLDTRRAQAGQLPVALMGKVCCKVDAQYSPIDVGDLLTTSPTPGYAMKAADPLRAFGAVIGKALRPLKDGQGIIPILIALQ